MWILFLLVLYWYYYSNSTCKKKNKKTGSKQCILMNHVWTAFFLNSRTSTPTKKQSPPYHPPSSTTTSHLSSKFLAFQLVFLFSKKSKKLFRLKEDKTWLRMFLKLIAWISLIVTRSKGRHLRWHHGKSDGRVPWTGCWLRVVFVSASFSVSFDRFLMKDLMFCCDAVVV